MKRVTRRNFLGLIGTGAAASSVSCDLVGLGPTRFPQSESAQARAEGRGYNGPYAGPFLNKIAFPIGGIGAGMFCLEPGTMPQI